MTLFPPLQIGWLNGWIPILVFYIIFIILLKVFPKNTVTRLYDFSNWTKQQENLGKIGLPFALIGTGLIIFSPLKVSLSIFWIGLVLYLVGFAGFIIALQNFNNTPLS